MARAAPSEAGASSSPGASAAEHFDAIAERHRGLPLILDHLGLPLGRQDAAAFASLDELLALFSEALDFLSVKDKQWILGRAALKWLGWRDTLPCEKSAPPTAGP
jgi:hypothetical protein